MRRLGELGLGLGIPEIFRDLGMPEQLSLASLGKTFRCDVKKVGDTEIIECELPGFKKEEIEISFEDDTLTISAKKEKKSDEEKENYILKERYAQSVKRSFCFNNIDEDNIKAKYEDGILTITVAKKIPEKTDKKISID